MAANESALPRVVLASSLVCEDPPVMYEHNRALVRTVWAANQGFTISKRYY